MTHVGAEVGGVPAPLGMGRVAALLPVSGSCAEAALLRPRPPLHLRALPSRCVPHGVLALFSPVRRTPHRYTTMRTCIHIQ